MKPRALLLLLLLFFLAIPLVGTGQTVNFEQEGFLPVIPTAPNVASFNKYQEVPISKYTGLPKITIPVFSIDLQDLQVPVVLDYHAGGIRVNETASWVGQNWNLVAGGNVTRTVKHLSDDATSAGYIHTPYTTEEIYGACVWGENQTGTTCTQLTIYLLQNNLIDFEPDIFHYSAPGISGKFMFDQNRSTQNPKGRIISIPRTDHRIEPVFTGGKITAFTVTDAQGNAFFFEGGDELLITDSHTVSHPSGLPQDGLKPFTHSGYYQTWNLSKITTYSGKEVHFSYSSRYYSRCTFALEKSHSTISGGPGMNKYTTYMSTTGYETLPESIYGDFGRIDFILGANDREDHDGKYLEAVEIRSPNGTMVKKVSMDYHYTTAANPGQYIYGCALNGSGLLFDAQNPQGYSKYTKRLFLEAVHVVEPGTTGSPGHSYHLEYNQSGVLPHRNSYAQDFWGYYNGADTNTTLCMDYRDYMGYSGPDRHIDPAAGQTGLLRKMTHPQGGHTIFEYESNRAVIPIQEPFGFRLVPFQDNRIEINTQAEPTPTAVFHNGDNVYTYKKVFLKDHRNFPLTDGYFQYASLTNSNCVYGPGNMPLSGSCALYMNIRKTTLDPQNVPDINQVNPHTVTYDSGFDEIRKLLNGEYGGGFLLEEPGVYVVELEVRTPVVPEPGGFVFDFQTEFAQLDLYFKTAHQSVSFFDLNSNNNYVNIEIPVGGQRIKTIKAYDLGNQVASARSFSYSEEGQNRSSGKILTIPYFIAVGGPTTADPVYESSLSAVPLVTTQGNNVGYTRVVESKQDVSGLLSDHTFIDEYSFWDIRYSSSNMDSHDLIPFIEDWRNGLHLKSEIPGKSVLTKGYVDTWETVEENDPTTHFFGIISPTTHRPHRFSLLQLSATLWLMGQGGYTDESFHRLQYGYSTLGGVTDTLFYDTGHTITQTFYSYGNPDVLSPTEIEKVYGQGKSLVTKLHYPSDLPGEAHMPALIASNRIAVPVLKETYLNTALIGKQKTVYNTFNGRVLPGFIQTAKGNDPMEDRLVYDSYDGKGNPLQVSMADGPKISYIYGYEGQYPVAKIENKPYSAIPSGLISAIHTASSPTGSESQLQTALNNLRNDNSMTGAMITTYTYKPLVGVTSITGPNGDRITYHYDAFGRLEAVKDKDGNLVQEHGYNYGNN